MPARIRVLRSFAMKRLAFLFIGLCLLVSVRAASAIDILDYGAYEVYQGDTSIGTETFAFERHGDSLFVHCATKSELPWPDRVIKLDKSMRLLRSEYDGSLVVYESVQQIGDDRLVRAISPHDTVMTVYREDQNAGYGDTIVKPPGRMYIIDAQLFTLFDVIVRDFADRKFDKRRLQMFVLAQNDTLVEGSIVDLGTETIRWGAKPVQARKLRIGDTQAEFVAYVGPQGRMLELREPVTGLRVIRKAQELKPPGSN